MSVRVRVSDDRAVDVDIFPDSCPHCRLFGQQLLFARAVETRAGGTTLELWVPLLCPVQRCSRPFFAVYDEISRTMRYSDDYKYRYSTPLRTSEAEADEIIASISDSFYAILNQAIAARERRLDLIAGMGYRKALEYLVKDYVTMSVRARYTDAVAAGDDAAAAAAELERASIVERPLLQVIQLIPDPLTVQVAERCAWLGNDETHYTRIWSQQDVADLQVLLDILTKFISSEQRAKTFVAKMQRG